MTQIDGAVAVVTGGAAGIGRGIVEQLLDEGASVVIGDIEPAALERTAAELGVRGVLVDVADPASVEALAVAVDEELGGATIVVNNAGVGPQAKLADMSLADWRWMVDVNLFGVVHGIRSFLPRLLSAGRPGHIVNTASMSAFSPLPGLGAYAATKSAVAALTEVLAAELAADGAPVRATLLAPGGVRTDIGRSLRNRPQADSGTGALVDVDLTQGSGPETSARRWLHPREVGRVVTRAIRQDDLYAVTHPEMWPRVADRYETLRAAFEADGD